MTDLPTRLRRRRPPRIVLVVSCAQRKRLLPPSQLHLRSISSGPDDRAEHWRQRLRSVDAPLIAARDLYVGDHWHAVRDAYASARRYSSRAELWVISAGYGLTSSTKAIKPYGATFSSGSADSVWRGSLEGDRVQRLQQWWAELDHQCTLSDLLPAEKDGAVVIAAGGEYVAVLERDLALASRSELVEDRLSVLSAGSRGNGARLPLSARFRTAVGGTNSSLNARILALLAQEATTHHFRRGSMAKLLERMASQLDQPVLVARKFMPDELIAAQIQTMRSQVPGLSRTRALRELRRSGIACEQTRFASLWSRTLDTVADLG